MVTTMSDEIILSPHQSEALSKIEDFLRTPGSGVFILKGYAGTGKTTLLQILGKKLLAERKNFVMLAPTGRAAAVLRAKTGLEAKTIHSELYHFSDVDGEADEKIQKPEVNDFGQMRLLFSVRPPDPEDNKIYIVDEASMVGDEPGDPASYAHFGSGHLLSDLLQIIGRNKVIFAGDPCQLPPIGSVQSPALDTEWMRRQGKTVQSYELRQILRQKAGSGVLQLATKIRDLSQQRHFPNYIKMPATRHTGVFLHAYESLKKDYVRGILDNGTHDRIGICFSNLDCKNINDAVRSRIHGRPYAPLAAGDVLMVTQNNYLVPLTNGDFVEVIETGDAHTHEGILFQEVRIKARLSEKEFQILLCLEPLFNGKANLTPDQQRVLMIDFSRRMRTAAIKPKSEPYFNALYSDPYLNSLRANFGYAVTCHKSQGGEWEEVCFFLHKGMYRMQYDLGHAGLARWWYTGITRAKERLHLVSDWWIA